MEGVPVTVGFFAASFAALGLSFFLLGIGVLWVPFAAVMCFNKAELAGLNSTRYAVVGALYSVLFLMPLIHLSARMDGKRVPEVLVVLAYVALYGGIWILGATAGLGFALSGASGWVKGISIPILSINVLSLIVSLAVLAHAPEDSTDESYRETLPSFAYILPFALAFVWLAVTAAVLFWGLG